MNQIKKSSWVNVLALIIGLNFFLTELDIQANEISLEEALNWGVEYNSTILEAKENIKTIERNLALVDTDYAFKVKVSANPIIAGDSSVLDSEESNDDNGDNTSTGTSNSAKISVETSKIYPSGIIVKSELYLKEEDWFDLENVFGEIKHNLSATKSIFPKLPLPQEQEKYLITNDLYKSQESLKWQQESKRIEFLESYINLLRLQERLFLAQTNYQYAQEDFDRTLKKMEIGEAGEKQEIEAKIALKKAEISFLQAQNTFNQEKKRWYLNLNLPEGVEVSLREDSPFLEETKEWVESLELNLEEQEKLMDLVVDSHYQIKNHHLDQDSSQKELEWNIAENKPQIDVYGAYTNRNNTWGVGISLSYDIFDGGKQKLENEEYRAKLTTLKDDYLDLIEELRLELNILINQLEIDNLNLEEKLMSYRKAQLEEESYQAQLQQGLISDSEFQYKTLSWREVEIDLKSAKDEILINKLRIAHFLGFRKKG